MSAAVDKTPVTVAQTQWVVDPAQATRLDLPALTAEGQIRLAVFAPLLSTNRVEVSTNLVHWATRALLVQTNQPTLLLDGPVGEAPRRYYRLAAP